ncbi:MvaI/BcnI family restriction endonuclease [Providencia stuartii]
MPLLESGTITMDHLIKRSAKNGRVTEKGPLFKINSRDLSLIFPEPVKYSLI